MSDTPGEGERVLGEDRQGVRASDAEREEVADALREHMLAGRLTSEELDERTGAAWSAVTLDDLDALTRDLPSLRAPAPAPPAFVLPEVAGVRSSTAMTVSVVGLGLVLVSAGLFAIVSLPVSAWAVYEGRREQREHPELAASRTATALGAIGVAISLLLLAAWGRLFL